MNSNNVVTVHSNRLIDAVREQNTDNFRTASDRSACPSETIEDSSDTTALPIFCNQQGNKIKHQHETELTSSLIKGSNYNYRLRRFRVRIGNNGVMHFSAYAESYNHAHSVTVYFLAKLGTSAISTGAIAHDIRTTFLRDNK